MVPRFGQAGRTLAFENCGLNMHTGTLIRIVQSTLLKPEDPQRGCPLNNLSQEMSRLDPGFRKRTAFEFPCLSPDRWRFRLRSSKNTEGMERNGNFLLSGDIKEA